MKVRFTLDSAAVEVDVPSSTSLLDVIRDLGVTGPKEGCRIGACGLCTVLIDGLPVSSCLYLAPFAQDADVLTAEGIAARHPGVVDAFVSCEGMQCGICTPGQVAAAAAARDELGEDAGEDRLREYLVGNLCRCTGYATIVEAVTAAHAS